MLRSYNTSSMCDICGEYRVRNPSPSLAFARGSKVMHMLMGEKNHKSYSNGVRNTPKMPGLDAIFENSFNILFCY